MSLFVPNVFELFKYYIYKNLTTGVTLGQKAAMTFKAKKYEINNNIFFSYSNLTLFIFEDCSKNPQ